MALEAKPQALLERIDESEKLRDAVVRSSENIIKEYHGSAYRTDVDLDDPAPENHWFEWLAQIAPEVIFDNPKVHLSSTRSGANRRAILGMKHAMNEWIRMVHLAETLDRIFYDQTFSYGVALTTFEPMPGYSPLGDLVARIPAAWRLAPHRWFTDCDVDHYTEGRYSGHNWKRDKEDLLNDPRFIHSAVAKIAADADLDKWDMSKGSSERKGGRKEIIGYEVWVPEIDTADDKLHHGTVFTLATAYKPDQGQKVEAQWIRKPRPFFGPRRGPYVLFGTHIVPNTPYPLSDFAAVYTQIRELNAHSTAAAVSAANYKSFAGYDQANQQAGKVLKNVKHGSTVGLPGMSAGSVKQFEIGGVKREMYEYLGTLHDRVDRVTGISQTSRGRPEKDVTATAEAEAAAKADNRVAKIRQKFIGNTVKVLDNAGWYLFNSEFSVFTLGPDAIPDILPRPKFLPPEKEAERIAATHGFSLEATREALEWNPKLIFAGGESDQAVTQVGDDKFIVTPNYEDLSYDDLSLEIEPFSMGRVSEVVLQRRQADRIALVSQIAPMMITAPWVDWPQLLGDWGEAHNMRDADEIVDMQMVEQFRDQYAQGQLGLEGNAGGVPIEGQLGNMQPARQRAEQIAGELRAGQGA